MLRPSGPGRAHEPIPESPHVIMYAIISTGGRQFRVEAGQVIRFPKLDGDKGAQITFDRVLHLSDGSSVKTGAPTVANAKVTGTILRQARSKKILVFKFKRRKGYEKRRGHRQDFTEVKIDNIQG